MIDLDEYNLFFSNPKNRSMWLQSTANRFGDFKTAHSRIANGEPIFTKHLSVLRCQETGNFVHLEQANNRQISDYEIVLDHDLLKGESLSELKTRFESTKLDLINKGIKFRAFFTGSKGYHIHIPLRPTDISTISAQKLKKIKSKLIANYQCDALKASSNVLIALEFAPHWKTGNQKKLIYDNTSEDLFYELSR